MIYLLCATQLLTILGAVGAIKWLLNHLEHVEQKQLSAAESTLAYMKSVSESSQEAMREIVTQSNEHVQRVIDQSYRDREVIFERFQHPEYMKAQAHSADKGDRAKPYTMGEEEEFQLEHPDAVRETPPVEASIPGARREDDEIKPVEPVTPFGRDRANGSQ